MWPYQLLMNADINQLISPILCFTRTSFPCLQKSFFAAKKLAKASPSRPTGMKLHRGSQDSGRRLFCCSVWFPYLAIQLYVILSILWTYIMLFLFHHSAGWHHFHLLLDNIKLKWWYKPPSLVWNIGDPATLHVGDVINVQYSLRNQTIFTDWKKFLFPFFFLPSYNRFSWINLKDINQSDGNSLWLIKVEEWYASCTNML